MFTHAKDLILELIVGDDFNLHHPTRLVAADDALTSMEGLGFHISELLARHPDLDDLWLLVGQGHANDIVEITLEIDVGFFVSHWGQENL